MSSPISRGWWFGGIAAITILLSAFLLFQVQPIESKTLLPWFGGNPSVWNTCVVFFQIALLAGYCYAHNLASRTATQQAWIHCTLLAIALATLTVIPGDAWKPTGGESASMRILLILLVHVGLPFFILSTTGPLVQMWFSRFFPGRSPYRLYALSNVGSLAALALYPFFFEPMFDLPTQVVVWKAGFVLFGLLIAVLAISMAMTFGSEPVRMDAPPDEPPPKGADAVPKKSFGFGTFLAWIALPWVASVASLAVTGHLTEDVPTVPFMLIVPFMLYLLSFIICFDAERWYVRWFFCGGCIVLALLLAVTDRPRVWDKMFSDANVSVQPSKWIDTAVNSTVDAVFYLPEKILTERSDSGSMEPSAWGKGLAKVRPHRFEVDNIDYDPVYQSLFYLTFLFFACMVCHGEVAALKPAPEHSTLFYLAIATGGALGGMFVALYCPTMSQSKIELPISIAGSVIAAVVGLAAAVTPKTAASPFWRVGLVVVSFLVLGAVVAGSLALNLKAGETWFYAAIGLGLVWGTTLAVLLTLHSTPAIYRGIGISAASIFGLMVAGLWGVNIGWRDPVVIDRVRGFFGVLDIHQEEVEGIVLGKSLIHGRIEHGYQHSATNDSRYEDFSKLPNTYYAANSGIGLALRFHPNAGKMRVAVVGLGTGTTAAYAGHGETYHFYEIDPKMVALSDKHFTYRADAKARGAEVEVKLGDARLTMERIEPQNYDVIAVDAFSGDSIPVHLLTEECMRNAYLKHLNPDGILAVHISNRYLDLEPVVRNLAVKNGMEVRKVDFSKPPEGWTPPSVPPILAENEVQLSAAPYDLNEGASYWVLVTKNRDFLNKRFLLISDTDEQVVCAPDDPNDLLPRPKIVAWTDRYSPLWQILSLDN